MVDWPVQFDESLLYANESHPHHIKPVSSTLKSSSSDKPSCIPFPFERLAYRGNLPRGDRAVRADRPFPPLNYDGLPEAFVMPYYLWKGECESLRMFPTLFKCGQEYMRSPGHAGRNLGADATNPTAFLQQASIPPGQIERPLWRR